MRSCISVTLEAALYPLRLYNIRARDIIDVSGSFLCESFILIFQNAFESLLKIINVNNVLHRYFTSL